MTPPDLAALAELMKHISRYGECYRSEISAASTQWIRLLTETAWVKLSGEQVIQATPRLLHLTTITNAKDQLRYLCFSIPTYRRYLLAVLIEGLVRAARTDYEELDDWIFAQLHSLANELNALLSKFEDAKARLVDWADDELSRFFEQWHEEQVLPAAWNHDLLNMHGAHDQIFSAVLERARYFFAPEPPDLEGKPITLLCQFDLPLDSTGKLIIPDRTAWSIRRREIYSSLPFFDEHGKALFDPNLSTSQVWQDILAEQPYYRAVLQSVIVAHLSTYSSSQISLTVSPDAPNLGDVVFVCSGQRVASLADICCNLVEVMGFHAVSPISTADIAHIFQHWVTVGAMTINESTVTLAEGYLPSLHEPRRARQLMRGTAGEEQRRINNYIREVARD